MIRRLIDVVLVPTLAAVALASVFVAGGTAIVYAAGDDKPSKDVQQLQLELAKQKAETAKLAETVAQLKATLQARTYLLSLYDGAVNASIAQQFAGDSEKLSKQHAGVEAELRKLLKCKADEALDWNTYTCVDPPKAEEPSK